MSRWVEVEENVAERHRLHGMRGWLRFFSFWIALSVIGGVLLGWQDIRALTGIGMPAPRPPAAAEAVLGLVISAVQIAVAVQWFRVWPRFRIFFMGLVAVAAVVAIGFDLWDWLALRSLPDSVRSGQAEEFAEQVASDVVGLAALCAFLLYMQFSRRFRVTFENRLRRDDPLLDALRSEPV